MRVEAVFKGQNLQNQARSIAKIRDSTFPANITSYSDEGLLETGLIRSPKVRAPEPSSSLILNFTPAQDCFVDGSLRCSFSTHGHQESDDPHLFFSFFLADETPIQVI